LEKRREERGLEIVNNKKSQVRRLDESNYEVRSQSKKGIYYVSLIKNEWVCDCPDHRFRGIKCKHAFAVEFSIDLREQVLKNVITEQVTVSNCVFCQSSSIKKFGVRDNKAGDIQRFVCDDCHKTFSINLGFERMKYNPQAITSAMQLYFSGESLRNTMDSLKLLGVESLIEPS